MTTFFFILCTVFISLEMDLMKKDVFLDFYKLQKTNDAAEKNAIMKKHNATMFGGLLYMVWTIIGLCMSSQWKLFGCLLLIGILKFFVYNFWLADKPKAYYRYSCIDSICCIGIMCYILVNHFHHF